MRIKDESKRIAIMEASIDLINETGFTQTSMSKIAKKAGVSPATIYIYFENKEDLLNNLYITANERMTREIFIDVNKEEVNRDSFSRIFKNIFFYFKNNSREFLFLDQFCSSPLINKVSKEETEKYYIPIDEFIERGIGDGIFKDYPVKLLEDSIFTQIFYLVKSHIGVDEVDESIISQAMTIAWDGIAVHG